ncbi:hypothetical protein SASPL_145333 [Salvia splendens]|uniref:DnaJ-like protein subfamily A member 2 n=1 Tax=Salvia splendens TaxID=180675 RepID=A0A8X8WIA7_SALSN|nr:hypothetical protein SASPL_145333 [Salvia splendens]
MFGRAPKKSDNSKYYKVLGVPKTASPDDLKKAYKKAIIKNYPEGMGEGGDMHDPFDIFSSFFGGSSFGGGGGTSKKLSLSRNVLCSKCKGKGSKSGASTTCSRCQGNGMKVTIRQLGPGMIQQMQHPCNQCKGTGETISDRDRCPQCKGEQVVQEKKVLEVHVEKGMQNGQKVTFPGEGDDLFVERTLSLNEALCGFQYILMHLDGRQFLIKSHPGDVLKPDSYKAINDEGMPIYRRSFMKGKLYIHFNVEFPDSLSPDQVQGQAKVLPPKPQSQLTDMEVNECEETTLHDVNLEEEMRRKQAQRQEAYDKDEDMYGGGAQRVQCAQQ